MSNDLEVLAKNRDALLLAEVAAWLHMFGKFHEKFLEGDHGMDIKIPGDVLVELAQLLKDDAWTGAVWNSLPVKEFQAGNISIEQLIETHRSMASSITGFLRLMADAHGRGSGIEKGILDRFAPPQEVKVYSSTSLGNESDSVINLKEIYKYRMLLYSFIHKNLQQLEQKSAKFDHSTWASFRREFIQRIKLSFDLSVAETRRPLNDVTLFDQTMISVAFFKAALAQNLLEGWKEPKQIRVADKYHWRLLQIGLDASSFWGDSARIGDLLARKKLIKEALDRVQEFIEVTCPLGLEVYRDENSSIFVVPDIDRLHQRVYSAGASSLEKYVQNIAEANFSGETRFTSFLSESTRNFLSFGRIVAEQLPLPTPNLKWFEKQWNNRREENCSVCKLRPQGPSEKALSRKICNVCEDRRIDRSEQWIKNTSTTIWLDEVADNAGRLVLVIAQFDIVDWLTGFPFNTILTFDPSTRKLTDPERGDKEYVFDLPTLVGDIERGLSRPKQSFNKNTLLADLVIKDDRGDTNFIQDFYALRISDTDLDVSLIPRSKLLALSMMRQPPSFARIHRTWQTTKKFWEDIETGLKSNLQEVTGRLRIRGNFIPAAKARDTLGISHTYEIRLDNINLSVVCVGEREFLTVDNLQRVAILLNAPDESRENYGAAIDYIGSRLREGESIEVEEPTGYGSPNTGLGRIQIETVTRENEPYMPAISILTEPRTFMALAPADKAFHIVESIKKKYEREMSKVRNRLPITIGVVIAGSRTPLPEMLDAGRRMLRQPTSEERWQINGIKKVPIPLKSDAYSRVGLTLEKDGKLLSLNVKTVMGDGETEDAWYPYWCVEADKDGLKPQGRRRQFVSADGRDWVHACDLQEGDKVYLAPSRFDFEFMDAAARRLEVSYEEGKRRGENHPARPYYLEELDSFKELWGILDDGLATSQIENLIGLIGEKRQAWKVGGDRKTFERIVSDILENAGWKSDLEGEQVKRPGKEAFEQLVQAALSGQLKDIVEFYSFLDEESKAER